MVYAPYNVLYHDYIIVLFSVGENTLDKSLFRKNCFPIMQKSIISPIPNSMWMTVTQVQTSIVRDLRK